MLQPLVGVQPTAGCVGEGQEWLHVSHSQANKWGQLDSPLPVAACVGRLVAKTMQLEA
jgi:hypothetical protein